MSQFLSQTAESSILLSVQLIKFSTAKNHSSDKQFAWVHVYSRNDLELNIRQGLHRIVKGVPQFTVTLKVYRSGQEQEVISLSDLVIQYRQFSENAGSGNPIKVVTRKPNRLAIAYPKDDVTVQRCEFKLSNEDDLNHLEDLFKTLGFPILPSPVAASATQVIHPSPSPALSIASMTSTASSSTAVERLSRPNSVPLPEQSQYGRALNSSVQGSSIVSSYFTPKTEMPSIGSLIRTTHIPSHRGATASSFIATSKKAETSKFCKSTLSQMETPPEPHFDVETEFGARRQHRNIAVVSKPARQRSSIEEFESTMLKLKSRCSTVSERQPLPISSGATTSAWKGSAKGGLIDPPVMRPSSAPACGTTENDVYIPPRRALPLPRGSRVRSEIPIDKSPLPKPTPLEHVEVQSTYRKMTDKSVTSPLVSPITPTGRKNTLQGVINEPRLRLSKSSAQGLPEKVYGKLAVEETLGTIVEEPMSPLAVHSAQIRRPASASSVLESKAVTSRKRPTSAQLLATVKRVKMVDIGTQVNLVGQSSTSISTDLSIPRSSSTLHQTSPSQDHLKDLDDYLTRFKKVSTPREVLQTTEYTNASQAERDILLNNFICQNLHDENFIQLGIDMERAWRRLGLEHK